MGEQGYFFAGRPRLPAAVFFLAFTGFLAVALFLVTAFFLATGFLAVALFLVTAFFLAAGFLAVALFFGAAFFLVFGFFKSRGFLAAVLFFAVVLFLVAGFFASRGFFAAAFFFFAAGFFFAAAFFFAAGFFAGAGFLSPPPAEALVTLEMPLTTFISALSFEASAISHFICMASQNSGLVLKYFASLIATGMVILVFPAVIKRTADWLN
jgi:signal transduction histidine kinase